MTRWSISEIKKYEQSLGDTVEEFTCYQCGSKYSCPFSYDRYNLNGDCLASK